MVRDRPGARPARRQPRSLTIVITEERGPKAARPGRTAAPRMPLEGSGTGTPPGPPTVQRQPKPTGGPGTARSPSGAVMSDSSRPHPGTQASLQPPVPSRLTGGTPETPARSPLFRSLSRHASHLTLRASIPAITMERTGSTPGAGGGPERGAHTDPTRRPAPRSASAPLGRPTPQPQRPGRGSRDVGSGAAPRARRPHRHPDRDGDRQPGAGGH
jgi:hypothetical protein